jgi:hypothetical protein
MNTTDYCAACGGPCRLDHCDHCGEETDTVRVYVRNAGSLPHFPANAEDGYYHLCADCAEEHGCNAYEGTNRSELWGIFFGDCTPARFMAESEQPSVEEAVEDYLDDVGRLAQLPVGGEPTDEELDTLRRAFVGYIEASLRS